MTNFSAFDIANTRSNLSISIEKIFNISWNKVLLKSTEKKLQSNKKKKIRWLDNLKDQISIMFFINNAPEDFPQ